MRSIYEYDNYRKYLKDFFSNQKKKKKFFSQRYFAQKAGFISHSFCAYLIKGKRNLTEKSLQKCIRGLNLDGKKAHYFKEMVLYNQSKTSEEKEMHFKSMNTLRRNSKFYTLNKHYYKYFEHWYMPVIRHLAVYYDWDNDYTRLAAKVFPQITPDKARKAIETLLEMGLLIIHPDGSYAHNATLINTDNVPVVINKKARRDILQKGLEAAESMGPKERFITYSTLSMSEKTYNEIVHYIEEVKKEIYNKVIEDESVERVHQMVIELFPVSSKFPVKKKKGER